MKYIFTFLFIALIFNTFANAQQFDISGWKDPKDRDEDISHTEITLEVSRTEDGFFEYKYKLYSPPEKNKGTLSTFFLDISCKLKFTGVTLPPHDNYDLLPEDKADKRTVPVSVKSTKGNSGSIGVDMRNNAVWGVRLEPGDTKVARLLSSTPPGEREYMLIPRFNDFGWNYDLYKNGSPEKEALPKMKDFVVHGKIKGPACTLETAPTIEY